MMRNTQVLADSSKPVRHAPSAMVWLNLETFSATHNGQTTSMACPVCPQATHTATHAMLQSTRV